MDLSFKAHIPIRTDLAGLFVSRGQGRHPDRTPDYHLAIVVREGTLFIAEEDQLFEVQANQALLLDPHKRHWGWNPYPKELSFYWLQFFVDSSQEGQEITLPKQMQVKRPDHLHLLFRRLLDEQDDVGGNPLIKDAFSYMVLLELGHSDATAGLKNSLHRIASEVNAYVALHHDQPISTSTISQALGYNPDYLGRSYKTVMGYTVTDSINKYRVLKACSLLLDTDDNIEDIARACGFRDVMYFRRVFKTLEGVTPSSYRKMHSQMFVNTY